MDDQFPPAGWFLRPNTQAQWMPNMLWDSVLAASPSRRDPWDQSAPSRMEMPSGGLLANLAHPDETETSKGGLLANLSQPNDAWRRRTPAWLYSAMSFGANGGFPATAQLSAPWWEYPRSGTNGWPESDALKLPSSALPLMFPSGPRSHTDDQSIPSWWPPVTAMPFGANVGIPATPAEPKKQPWENPRLYHPGSEKWEPPTLPSPSSLPFTSQPAPPNGRWYQDSPPWTRSAMPFGANVEFSAEPADPAWSDPRVNIESRKAPEQPPREVPPTPSVPPMQDPNSSYNPKAMFDPAPPEPPKDFRTRMSEALSDANVRYYLGPGFYEAFQKLASLAQLLPGSGTVQATQDASRAGEEAHRGNYGQAAANLALGTANAVFDWVPPAKLAILGGMAAKTFPWHKLKTVEGMEKAGRSAEEIWHATGLERGADGYWRFEISDKGYRVNPNAGILNAEGYRVAPLYKQQEHLGMQEAYPGLAEMRSDLKISPREPVHGVSRPHGIQVRAPDLPWARFVDMHELQHTIARLEGHARGGSPNEFMGPNVSRREAENLYWRLAGEVEARNAQQRMFMNEMERRLRSPKGTEVILRNRQIILFDE